MTVLWLVGMGNQPAKFLVYSKSKQEETISMSMTKEQVKETLDKALALVSFVAKWTPTAMDDKLVGVLTVLSEKDWFLEMLAYAWNFYDSRPVPTPSRGVGEVDVSVEKHLEELLKKVLSCPNNPDCPCPGK